MLRIDNETIGRLRDALVVSGRNTGQAMNAPVGAAQNRGTSAALERVSPFVETMYLVMMADGRADEAELLALRGALKILTQGMLK